MPASQYSAIYSFGDSLSDTGDAYLLTSSVVASALGQVAEPVSPPYYQETYTASSGGGTVSADVFSNGQIWVQNLATALGLSTPGPGEVGVSANTLLALLEGQGDTTTQANLVVQGLEFTLGVSGSNPYLPLTPGVANGTDFAIGGSVTGPTDVNGDGQVTLTDLSAQLANFMATVPTPSPNALYTVWSGSNDLLGLLSLPNFASLSATTIAADIAESVNNEVAMIDSLIAGGAKTVLVMNVPDLGKTPNLAAQGAAVAAAGESLASSYNTLLAADLAGVTQVKIADVFSLIKNAAVGTDGLTNVTDAVYTGSLAADTGSIVSTDPTVQDQYLFFDSLHPTETGQQAVAALALQALNACFAEGTLIATPNGDVPVQALSEGDTVLVRGGTATVGWIGRREASLAGRPGSMRPVRIQAGAFGAGLPVRDLVLSPEHAVFTAGVLVPARALCGCPGIVADLSLDHITYYHIALDQHAVVLAEGLSCETWLDTGNRAMFDNAPLTGAAPTVSCAALVDSGPVLDGIRSRLGGAATQEVHLDRAGRHAVAIAPGTGAIRLASRVGHAPGDARALGAAVAALALDGQDLALDDTRLASGFHAPEASWRWTNGAALLTVGQARTLVVEVAALAA